MVVFSVKSVNVITNLTNRTDSGTFLMVEFKPPKGIEDPDFPDLHTKAIVIDAPESVLDDPKELRGCVASWDEQKWLISFVSRLSNWRMREHARATIHLTRIEECKS